MEPSRAGNMYPLNKSIRANVIRICLFLCGVQAMNALRVPRFNATCHIENGDLNIGVMVDMTTPSLETLCQDVWNYYAPDFVTLYEAFVYTIRRYNDRQDILPNITLGVVGMDSCFSDLAALALVNNLIDEPEADREYLTGNDNGMMTMNCNDLSVKRDSIVGVVGASTSTQAVLVGSQLSVFQIPIVSATAASDELSDKMRYKYFSRLASPLRFEVEAILDFFIRYNWTYVSFLYSEGNYGESAAKSFFNGTKRRGICPAVSEMFANDWQKDDVMRIAEKLVRHSSARVVLLFLYQPQISQLFSALKDIQGHTRGFLWFGSASVGHLDLGADWHGGFTFAPQLDTDADFRRHMLALTPAVDQGRNPWLRRLWADHYQCEWPTTSGNTGANGTTSDAANATTSCERWENTTFLSEASNYSSTYIDAAQLFAMSLDSLIRTDCPGAFHDSSLLSNCITGARLLNQIRNTSFVGSSGYVQFDENGDRLSQFAILQFLFTRPKGKRHQQIASVNVETGSIEVFGEDINWQVFQKPEDSTSVDEANNKSATGAIKSICSIPCEATEYVIPSDEPCCWECRVCRENERLNENATGCDQCPELTWPDDVTRRLCQSISPDFLRPTDSKTVILYVFCGLGTMATLIIIVWYLHHRNMKLIKASSRELSLIILVGVILAFFTGLVLTIKPSDLSCKTGLYGFVLAMSLIYVPMLVKTNRIFRIFASGKQGTRNPRLINNKGQLVITSLLLLIQVAISVGSGVVKPTQAQLRMPVVTVKHVELYCDIPLEGLLPPLAYNLVVIMLCSAYGFATRKLPENFNESMYIFKFVVTTTFVWLVFLPTYFLAFYATHQVLLLSSSLIINALVTLVCLFVPKVYAVHWVVDEGKLNVAKMPISNSGSVNPSAVVN